MEDLTEFFSKEIIFVCIRFNTNIGICMYNHSPGDVHVKTCFGFFLVAGGGGGGGLGKRPPNMPTRMCCSLWS